MKLAELIAIIVGSGTKGKSALELGQEVVAAFPNLGDATVQELSKIKGVGLTKATAIFAEPGLQGDRTTGLSQQTDKNSHQRPPGGLIRGLFFYAQTQGISLPLTRISQKWVTTQRLLTSVE